MEGGPETKLKISGKTSYRQVHQGHQKSKNEKNQNFKKLRQAYLFLYFLVNFVPSSPKKNWGLKESPKGGVVQTVFLLGCR
jgi:hypothetical protein